MACSAEIRWFFRGACPKVVSDWFESGGSAVAEPERTDVYLLIPGCTSAGLKLRQGKLELKAIIAEPRLLPLGPAVVGRTDGWEKWSHDGSALSGLHGDLQRTGTWISVRKQRGMRKFTASSQGVDEVSPNVRPLPEAGCNVELTRIVVDRNPAEWYTIGFESFGPRSMIEFQLVQTARWFIGRTAVPSDRPLVEENSLSYPAWLHAEFGDSGSPG